MKKKMSLFMAAMMLLTAPATVSFASDASDVIIAEEGIVETELSVTETTETGTEETGEDAPMVVVEEIEETTEPETTVETESETETELIQLATPTDIGWGKYYDSEISGAITWYAAQPTQNIYQILFYKVGENGEDDTLVEEFNQTYDSTIVLDQMYDPYFMILEEREAGTYYFTVQSIGDGITYSDSEIAVSDNWVYQPETEREQVSAPSAPVWTGEVNEDGYPICSWDYEDYTLLSGYRIIFYYTEDLNDTNYIQCAGITSGNIYGSSNSAALYQNYGTGYYYAKVMAYPADFTKYTSSDFSDLSEPYYLSIVDVSEELANIDSSAGESEIKDAVQAIDTAALATAMEKDTENTGVIVQLTELEEKVGGSTIVTVTEDMDDTFDASEISVVGALLNTSSGNATLTVGKINEEDVIPTQVKNAVGFSMNLTGEGVDSTDLSVPVKITLPVPSTINPDFLVILHYHQDGTVEQVSPYIYVDEGGLYYASFVITSFSDFVMYDSSAVATDISGCGLSLSVDSYTYDGTAKTPTVTVTNGSEILVENTDYTVEYSDNTAVGTATVTVTGIGDYTGTLTATFTIVQVAETETEKQTEKQTESESEVETETESEIETETESETEQAALADGLNLVDGKWVYCKDGSEDTSFNGIVEYNGGSFFVANGVLCGDAHGLNLYGDTWYFLAYGQVQTQYTGFALYDGEWFYIKEGVLDTNVNGLMTYDGEQFLFVEGHLLDDYNGLWLNSSTIGGDDQWYFIATGMVQNVSLVAMYDGEWFVVKDGILDTGYNGTIEYDGATFNVVNGQLYG